jgi:TRAP transporter 4TM/12TM fusion protein
MQIIKRAFWLLFQMGNKLPLGRTKYAIFALLAVPLTIFEVWYALAGEFGRLELAIVFVVPMYVISFLAVSYAPDVHRSTIGDYVLSGLSLVGGLYLISQMDRYHEWISGLSEFLPLDLAAAGLYLVLTLELLRRCVGPGISVVVWLVIAYCLFGQHLPGFFGHRGLEWDYLLEGLMVSPHDGGLFSAPVQVAAVYAFLFVTFGKFLEKSGGGEFFFNLAALLAGRASGGSAKVSVTSSGLFGMISGSPAADVMTTGSITIPMMKRAGYPGRYAGAVEAVAATGGALLPPVMGAVVFLMVEFTGIEYGSIMVSIIASALLYYAAIYTQVHCFSCRHDVGKIDSGLIPTLWTVVRTGWVFVVPMGILVYYMLAGYTPALAATIGLLSVIVASWSLSSRITPSKFIQGCVEVCTALAPLIAAVAGAGILMLGLNVTGLASKLAALIFGIAQANLLLALLMAALVTIICGMGMPVVAVYSLVAVMVAPALVEAGLTVMQAHLFLVFYAVASYITPPVAVSAYVASTIADERPMAVSLTAAKIGVVAFLLPFAFVYNPGLLLIGSWEAALFDIAKVSVGVLILAAAAEGWYHGDLNRWVRVALIGAGLLSISAWDMAGVVALLVAGSYLMAKRFLPLIDQRFRADRDWRRVCIKLKKKAVEIKQ